jgi:rRNA processing protein Gar1
VKALGRISTITYSGKLIARANWVPEIGTKVVDREFRVIGTVAALLGPVDNPYVSIRPVRSPGQTLLKLIGKDVYAK